jgi:hypothetical protein
LIPTAVPVLVSMPLLIVLLVLLMLLLVRLLLVLLFLLMRRLLLLNVPLLLLTRRLALLVLLLVLLILLVRRLLLLNVPLLLFAHRLTLLVLLLVLPLRRLVCPISVLPEPIGMTSRHPIRIPAVPPLSVMPFVLLVAVAITVAPAWVERGPILVIVIEPIGIVLLPPIGHRAIGADCRSRPIVFRLVPWTSIHGSRLAIRKDGS